MGQEYDAPSLDDVARAIDYLDFNDRETWVYACFAIKSEFGESGFDVWDSWGRQYKKYRAGDALSVWRSDRGGKTGISWLFARAVAQGYKANTARTQEDTARLQAERSARAAVLEKERAADLAWANKMADVVAAAAADIVANYLAPVGRCAYIGQKNITPYGALFPREPLILITDIKNESCRIISGFNAVREYWDYRKTDAGKAAQAHEFSLSMGKGCLVLPMRTLAGDVRNLQVITKAAKTAPKKLFIKCGEKTGTYLRMGNAGNPELVTEGWATGCTLHKACGLPVWVTWDCGGLLNFAKEMLAQSRGGDEFLICGDDDALTENNPGKTKALAAAQLLGGLAVLPVFPSNLAADKARSDFNDLQHVSGLEAVATQVLAGVERLKDGPASPAPSNNGAPADEFEDSAFKDFAANYSAPPVDAYDDYDLPAANEPVNSPDLAEQLTTKPTLPPTPNLLVPPDLAGCFNRYALIADDSQSKIWDSHAQKILKQKAVKDFITPEVFKQWLNDTKKRRTTMLASILPLAQKKAATVELGGGGLREALERYVYLNPSQNVWDNQEREVVAVNDLRIAIAADYSDWVQHPERKEIKACNLVFDPTQKTPAEGFINRFTGLPLKPKDDIDNCKNIMSLMIALCNNDKKVVEWLVSWLAYPLQNVGAKMRSAVLMHSDVHGSGKSFFFDGVMRLIYGKYCRTLGQTQLESQYNDWQSEILFGVFEEVLSRGQKYSHTGTIKQMVTGQTFRVEKKFMSGWEESNHMNGVFLSNEVQPLPIEPSDRRFLVVWPELKLLDELKDGVVKDLENGGAEAFYHFLLNYDLTGFNEFSEPPVTEAKKRIIDHGKSTWENFYEEWKNNELDYPYCSVRVSDLFKAYDRYCNKRRESCMGQGKFISFIHSKERKKQRDVNYDWKGFKGKATFIIINNCPLNKTKQEWLGGCVQDWHYKLSKIDQEAYQDAS